jgi:hypothetical protein
MDATILGLAEPLLVFGGLVLFMLWQFRELRQRAKARERATREAEHVEAAAAGTAEAGGAGPRPSDEPPRHPPG